MNPTARNYLRYTSWPIIAAMVALMVVGVTAIRISEKSTTDLAGFSQKQAIFAMAGLGVFVLMTLVPYVHLGRLSYAIFALTMLSLVGIFALHPIRGSHRWIPLGPIMVQPSEIAKFSVIIMLAWYLRYGSNYRRLLGLIVPFVLTLLPMALVLIEPDLGTALLFPPTLMFMLFMAGARLRHLAVILLLGLLLVFVPVLLPVDKAARAATVVVLDPHAGAAEVLLAQRCAALGHQARRPVGSAGAAGGLLPRAIGARQRVRPSAACLAGHDGHRPDRRAVSAGVRLAQPGRRAAGAGQGISAAPWRQVLGAGGTTGRSDWNDNNAFFQLLPDDHDDFIFCVVGGQWGLLGCVGVFLLYGVIFLFGFEIALITYDPFARLLVVGVLALLFSQIVINVGMTMGLTPVTGMTLPLISYGGTSLVVNCAALGLLVNVGQHRPILLGKRPFEHED